MNQTHPTIPIDLVLCFLLRTTRFELGLYIQVVDRQTIREVLNGILHTILFHRLFGTIKPKTLEVLDVTMVFLGYRL